MIKNFLPIKLHVGLIQIWFQAIKITFKEIYENYFNWVNPKLPTVTKVRLSDEAFDKQAKLVNLA